MNDTKDIFDAKNLEWLILGLFIDKTFPLWGHGWLVPIVGVAIIIECIGVSLLVNKIKEKNKEKKELRKQQEA